MLSLCGLPGGFFPTYQMASTASWFPAYRTGDYVLRPFSTTFTGALESWIRSGTSKTQTSAYIVASIIIPSPSVPQN